jgi:hypothetical protein
MKAAFEFISGKKTYIVAALVGVIAAAQHLGYELPSGTFELLAAMGLGTLRAAVKKGEI